MVENSYGRQVVQTARVIPAAGHIDTTAWPACKSIGVIDSWRQVGDKPAQWERRYYISSRDLDGEALGRAVRAHWVLEWDLARMPVRCARITRRRTCRY